MNWTVELVNAPAEFLARSEPFRMKHPMETNVIGSIATSIADGGKTYDAYFFWLVLVGDEVVGVALRTVPYRMLVSPMPAGAAAQLAVEVVTIDPECWGVTGPEEVAAEFVGSLCSQTGRDSSEIPLGMRETTYVLGVHTPLVGVKGAARMATEKDIPLLLRWFPAFVEEVGLFHSQAPSAEDLRARIAKTVVMIWEVAGRPVAMSGHATLVDGADGKIGRIGPVYTEPHERGFGYGAAVTSAMIDHLKSVGCSTIMLYADSGYEKSNRVYQGLGFHSVGAMVEFGTAPFAD